MVIVYHKNKRIVNVVSCENKIESFSTETTIAGGLLRLAEQFPQFLMVWCHLDLKNNLDKVGILDVFHHNKMMLSYTPEEKKYFGSNIGYVDTSPFIKMNNEVSYPTWQMSSSVGAIHASVLLEIKDQIKLDSNFDYFLCSLAKLAMPKGLLCYSEPKLLKQKIEIPSIKQASTFKLFRFVKQHYRIRWVFLLLFNLIVYERKFPMLPFLISLFYRNRTRTTIDLDAIKVQSSRKVVDAATIDVIIPTIGRKQYLYDVLKDLSKQTHLPKKIMIVEQNPKEDSTSELDYLTTEKWPFEIQHIFTHQAGACNARNMALEQIKSEWIFFADDDIRFNTDFIQETLEQLKKFGVNAASIRCYQKGERQNFNTVFQWASFGSGSSFVYADILKGCEFKKGYEFGFGEDADFGMQLRNKGQDVLYLPKPKILHLKAPLGGFRTKSVLQWHHDSIQPKPSPTVMLYRILHHSTTQINSYKTTLFFKYYKIQKIRNPFKYYIHFQKQWRRSVFWANKLQQQNEI